MKTHLANPTTVSRTILPEPLSPAQKLTLAIAQTTLSDSSRERVAAIAATFTPEDWSEAARFSTSHGLASLLWHHVLGEELLPLLPQAVAHQLRQGYQGCLLTQLRLTHTLKTLLTHAHEAGIDLLPFKGVMLSERLYGNLGLRTSIDLDVLVSPQVSQQRAYHALTPCFTEWNARGIRVELAWDLVRRPPYQSALPHTTIWGRSQETTFHGLPCRRLAPEDELRYLCTHCALHSFQRLIWLTDIAEWLRRVQEDTSWDWPHFVQESIGMGVAFPVATCLLAAQQWLHAPVPEDALAALAEATSTAQEQARWLALQEPGLFVRRALLALRSTASFAERWQLTHTILWPDLAYLYDNADWTPSHSASLARMRRLRRIVWRGLH